MSIWKILIISLLSALLLTGCEEKQKNQLLLYDTQGRLMAREMFEGGDTLSECSVYDNGEQVTVFIKIWRNK